MGRADGVGVGEREEEGDLDRVPPPATFPAKDGDEVGVDDGEVTTASSQRAPVNGVEVQSHTDPSLRTTH